ncbi:TPA: Flp pilus assembly complex ATPase component TadA [archaeon]|nr:Flp pilus assembly complex ATPase component TadA [Candidatus Naiadarchaeales archaeon SRR2090153.bin461]
MSKTALNRKTVPDTSVLVSGKVSKLIESGELNGEIVILEAVLSEMENQANKGRATGFEGLDELAKLKELEKAGKIKITFYGNIPTPEEIKAAQFGAIDALIRNTAAKLDATLLTADYVQHIVAKSRGIKVHYLEKKTTGKPRIQDYFDKETTSVHLKVGAIPFAKKGKPGQMKVVQLSPERSDEKELMGIIKEIVDYGREKQSIEISMKGATVVQMGDFRVAIAEPPFSDGLEVTAVRPIAKVSLDSYTLSDKLLLKLRESAEGVLICGPPGAGKSSFAAALAEYYVREKKSIVKTMESPRDLQVPPEITQYAPLEGQMSKTADILLLVRPDYTFYDEVRKTQDFQIFADMRLAGVGMIGVPHESQPIDALQRMVSRLELGQIPLIVDTVIYIKDAEIKKVYETKLSVKVPAGMFESDLARPVVEVKDFETGEVEYEMYTYGEETVIMRTAAVPKEVIATLAHSKSEYILDFGDIAANKNVTVYAGKNFMFKTKLGKEAAVRIRMKEKYGEQIRRAMRYNDKIRAVIEG